MSIHRNGARAVRSLLAAVVVAAALAANVSIAAADPMVPVTVTVHHVFGSNPDLDVNGPGDYYVKVRIGDHDWQTSPGNPVESGDFRPKWHFTRTVDAAQPIPITIELWDSDVGVHDHIDINPLDGQLNVNAVLNYVTGTWTAGAPGHETGFAAGDGDFEVGNELYNGWAGGLEFDISPDVNGDVDDDGLYDGMERFGIRNADGTVAADLAALGADPCRKSLAVEIDWFNVPGDHDHKPSDAAIAEVEAAFANAPVPAVLDCPYAGFPKGPTGVDIILDLDSPIDVTADLDANGPFGTDELGLIKADPANFDPARQGIFHYNVWAHTLDGTNVSGVCCWEGTDFVTSLGEWENEDGVVDNGTVRDQSGTFMHEFGHALGLGHGGTDGVNYKPNYLSVMNYLFQTVGIPDADLVTLSDWDKNAFEVWARPDYSHTALSPLNETSLDETLGIGDGDALTAWRDATQALRTGRGDTPLDWDWDSPGGAGPFEATAVSDLNLNREEACVIQVGDALDTTPEGDDFVFLSERIYSGPDRTCDTTAAGNDEQTHQPGWVQPVVLVGASDWDKITYLGPAIEGAGADVAPHKDLTADEAKEIKAAWKQAVNRPPVAEAGGPYQVNEGSQVQLDGSASTDPNGDPLSFEWSPATHLTDPKAAKPVYSGVDDSVDQLTLTVKDPQGLAGSDTTTVTVENVGPSVVGSGATIEEGATASVSATFTDPGAGDIHTATIDWGDGTPAQPVPVTQGPGSGSLNASHVYGDNGTFTVTIKVTDDDGGVGSDTVSVDVKNVNPTFALDTSGTVAFPGGQAVVTDVGQARLQAATAKDAGSDDLTFVWTVGPAATYFNNGIGPDPSPSPGGTFPFEATDDTEASYASPGAYAIGLTVKDDDGGSAGGQLTQVVVGTADKTSGTGYWKQQYSGTGNPKLDQATLNGYLAIVNHVSSVFSEARPLATVADATAVLSPNGGDKRAVATSDLLAAWLHFASGAVPWNATVSLEGNQSSPFLTVMSEIESILLNPNSTNSDLVRASALAQKTMQAS